MTRGSPSMRARSSRSLSRNWRRRSRSVSGGRTASSFPGDRRELLGLELLRERIDDLVQIAVHDRVDPVEREVDAVVGDAALREIVGADALAAVARADQALARGRFGARALAALAVEQAR